MKTSSSSLTLEKVSKRRYVFLVIAPNVGRHAFLDRWRNAQKDGQGDQVRDRGEHSFAKLKVTYNQFLAWLKRTKKEQIVQLEKKWRFIVAQDDPTQSIHSLINV